jgi:hypothetical protein
MIPIHIINLLSDDKLLYLQEYANTLNYNESNVYNREKNEISLDINKRLSYNCDISDYQIINIVENDLFDSIMKNNHDITMINLAVSTIRFIKYTHGGFFDYHMDNNQLGNARLLFCINNDCDDKTSQFVVQHNDNELIFDDKQNECIIFDKSMLHKRNNITGRNKTIMVMDVSITTKMNESRFSYKKKQNNDEDDFHSELFD